ncbi:TPA: long-chain fatty acid--CoA ligase [Candidatus Komeilibacteria bacterium]|nr:MAG: hypothetical protein A3J95_03900 [Candidatus Komeilibacteria bacterium RIFOXYC2_FULL_45_12]HAH04539.1 long-chain fatty acid--CoA ligase [Candidatus Komeilibacteria bacterium]
MATAETIFRRFEQVAGLYPNNVALGYKVNEHYETLCYQRLLQKVNCCVTGLKKLGIKAGDKVAIFSKNRPEWIKLDLALNKIGAISVPIHTSFSPKLIKYVINNSGAKYLAVGDYYSKYQEIKNEVNLEQVITFNRIEWQEGLIFFDDLIKEEPDNEEPADFEVCTIIYTSGTTGEPKGVMLTNNNFISNIEAATKYVPYTAKDIFLSFLPLSHVLERSGGYYGVLFYGGAIYFATSRQTLSEDIKKVRPTIMVSVPMIFEKVYDKIMDKVRAQTPFKQRLFFKALDVSRAYLNANKNNSPLKSILKISYYFADKFIISKIRNNLGGRLKFTISGGASLNPSIARFFETTGIKILEGYGLTETSPIIAVNPVNDYKFGSVGKVVKGVELKIAEDKEILVKGPNVMKGYYNNEIANTEAFKDSWFKTGDLGYLDKEGYLTIIGRKKEMIVTSNGKNINPVGLELALQESKYITQAMVMGEKQKYLSALIVPDFEELKIYAESNNIQMEMFELIKSQVVHDLLAEEICNQLKNFPDNEQIRKFIVLDREFSEEREELTPTLKLRRNMIMSNL